MKQNVVIVAVVGWIVGIASIATVIAVTAGGPSKASAERGHSRRRDRARAEQPRQDPGEVPELNRVREARENRRPRRQSEPDWRDTLLHSDLQTLRSQVELYKVQHLDEYPGVRDGRFDPRLFEAQLLGRTNAQGAVQREGREGDFPYGPYLRTMPANPFVPENVATQLRGGEGPCPGDRTSGWWVDSNTGRLDANDPEHRDL